MNPNRIEADNLKYQKPPKEILDLVDVPRAPFVQIDRKGKYMLFIYRDSYQRIAALSEEELRLGGLRVNPITNIGSRTIYYNNLQLKLLQDPERTQVIGLPKEPKLANFIWSPCQTKLAFTHTTLVGVEVWVLDVKTAKASVLTSAKANANLGNPITWFEDSKALLVKLLPAQKMDLINTTTAIPTGPTISVSDGSKAQNRTYQDLLKNRNDEHNFEALTTSELHKVDLEGQHEKWLEDAGMYRSCLVAPNGEYVQVMMIHRPFSYLIPYSRFPHVSTLYTKEGALVKVINEVPLTEDIPKGFMSVRKGRRMLQWRSDQGANYINLTLLIFQKNLYLFLIEIIKINIVIQVHF